MDHLYEIAPFETRISSLQEPLAGLHYSTAGRKHGGRDLKSWRSSVAFRSEAKNLAAAESPARLHLEVPDANSGRTLVFAPLCIAQHRRPAVLWCGSTWSSVSLWSRPAAATEVESLQEACWVGEAQSHTCFDGF